MVYIIAFAKIVYTTFKAFKAVLEQSYHEMEYGKGKKKTKLWNGNFYTETLYNKK